MSDCVFCKIAKGEIPAEVFYEDEKIMVILNISPEAAFHALAIPREHLELNAMSVANESLLGRLILAAKEVGADQSRDGFRLIINNGINAGQEIAHLHVHILGGESLGSNLCLK